MIKVFILNHKSTQTTVSHVFSIYYYQKVFSPFYQVFINVISPLIMKFNYNKLNMKKFIQINENMWMGYFIYLLFGMVVYDSIFVCMFLVFFVFLCDF